MLIRWAQKLCEMLCSINSFTCLSVLCAVSQCVAGWQIVLNVCQHRCLPAFLSASLPVYLPINLTRLSCLLIPPFWAGFIRKVYLTLMIQLLVTVGIICTFLYWWVTITQGNPSVRDESVTGIYPSIRLWCSLLTYENTKELLLFLYKLNLQNGSSQIILNARGETGCERIVECLLHIIFLLVVVWKLYMFCIMDVVEHCCCYSNPFS